jgi:uncharacterized membrane protein
MKNISVYIIILILTLFWCSFLVIAPLLIERNLLGMKVSTFIYFFYSLICHQIPERSFQISGYPLAVCSRCTGIYVGFLSGLIFIPFLKRRNKYFFPPVGIFGIAFIPMLLEFSLSRIGLLNTTIVIRSLTGLIPGVISVFYILPALMEMVKINEVNLCMNRPAS